MRLFKPLFIPKVDYTGVPSHKDGYWCSLYRRKRYSRTIHNFADERRLVEEVEAKLLKQCGWLIDWMYDNMANPDQIVDDLLYSGQLYKGAIVTEQPKLPFESKKKSSKTKKSTNKKSSKKKTTKGKK